jgi:hypothetical protein
MTAVTLYLNRLALREDTPAVLRVADWLSLGAAPTFACMAALTVILGGGAHEMLCLGASRMSALSGMVPMYGLMSAVHLTPWLGLISRRRDDPRPADVEREGGISPSFVA